jgi:hypothetical protein
MKKKILIFLIVIVVGALASWNFNQAGGEAILSDVALTDVEALANDESGGSGIVIYCKCTRGIFSQNCKANGDNGVCAQSTQGGNIDCSQYNSNC